MQKGLATPMMWDPRMERYVGAWLEGDDTVWNPQQPYTEWTYVV
jgi:hypothetical protein